MKGLNSKSYLTRNLLNVIFKKTLSDDDIIDLLLKGKIEKHFSYYKPTEELLRELKIIPEKVEITDFARLAKSANFVMKDLQDIFNSCNKDTVKLIINKYFIKKYNYYYKNDILIELLNQGQEYVII